MRLGRFLLWISAAEFPPDPKFLRLSFRGYTRCFTLPAFVGLLLTRWLVACTNLASGSHHVLEGCSQMVSEEFIRHAESHLQVLPPGNIDFRADSSPSPPTTQQQQPPAELVGCVTQSREEVKTWVCSNLNAGVLLHSCSGFDT